MKLQLERKHQKDGYTIGELYIDDVFFCHTLEDIVRDKNHDGDLDEAGEEKVYGKTAIPFGKYNVIITPSARFKRDLPLVQNVKGFEGIRIHPGNTAEDTLGCILVGVNDSVGRISNSLATFNKLFALMKASKQLVFELEII